MLRHTGLGATAFLAAGLLALGCSEDGKTILVGGDTDPNNSDDFGATSIASNNLAPDGGGLSPDGTDVLVYRTIFDEDLGSSDGASVAACQAVILFSTTDGRTFVTHYDGATITPPVELEARDHSQLFPFQVESACVSFGHTSGYENSVATPDVVDAVRRNHGFISLVMAGETSLQVQSLNINGTGGSSRGVHTGLWAWLFVPAFRGTERLVAGPTTNPIGGVTAPTSRYYNGATSEFRFGWQHDAGDELSLNVPTGVTPAVSGGVDPGADGVTPDDSPRADVLGYGLVTDGNQRQQLHLGSSNVTTTLAGRAQTFTTGAPLPGFALTSPGEAVNVLGCVFTQIVTSLDQGGTNTGDFLGGSTVAAFVAPFNLATLSYEAVQRIVPPTSTTGRNVAYDPSFLSYDHLAFLRYTEYTPQSNVAGFDPYLIVGQETLLQKVALRQTPTGSASLGSSQDLATRTTAAGLHRQFDPASTVDQEQEDQSYAPGGLTTLFTGSRVVYGRDEGLAETVLFFGTSDATGGGGQEDGASTGFAGNTDRALYAALFTRGDVTTSGGAGSTDGDLAAGPLLVSRHRNDDVTTSVGGEFSDAVEAESTAMNRTGSHVLACWVQRVGSTSPTALDRRRTLRAVVYQTVRPGGAQVPFASRFSAPIEVSDPATGAGPSTALDNGRGANDREPNLPVNAWAWQGGIDYRTGFQSDPAVSWVLWEQSDGTEDRLFARALAVTLPAAGGPSISTTNVSVELDEQASERVPSDGVDTAPSTPGLERSLLAFLDGELADGARGGGTSDTTVGALTTPRVGFELTTGAGEVVQSCDLGAAGAQANASRGGLFLAYRKTTDATRPALVGTTLTGDADGFDASLFANAVLVGATADLGRVQIDAGLDEDDADGVSPIGSLTTAQDVFRLAPAGGRNTAARDVATQPNLVYVFFTEPTQRGVGDTSDGLFVRTFDAARLFRAGSSAGLAADFRASFFPPADPAAFAPPTRLDHTTGGDVEGLIFASFTGNERALVTSGDAALVVFVEDGHDWGNGSLDGRTFLTSGGAPAPVLVDNDRTTNSGTLFASELDSCEDDSGEFRNAIYLGVKPDNGDVVASPGSGDLRLVLRGAKTRLP